MSDTETFRLARINWLLFAAVVVGGVTLFTVRVVIPYQRLMRLIEEIEAMIGWVGTEEVGPDWLRALVGDERMRGFYKIYSVGLGDAPLTIIG